MNAQAVFVHDYSLDLIEIKHHSIGEAAFPRLLRLIMQEQKNPCIFFKATEKTVFHLMPERISRVMPNLSDEFSSKNYLHGCRTEAKRRYLTFRLFYMQVT
jgi:hypothetical protein